LEVRGGNVRQYFAGKHKRRKDHDSDEISNLNGKIKF
jgi:hypothetical protein